MLCAYAFCASLLFLLSSQRFAMAATGPTLAHPTGDFSIGRTDFDWTDESRPESLSTIPGAHRELLVALWYPCKPNGRPGADAPYLRGASIIDKSPDSKGLRDTYANAWPFIANGKVPTHATENAAILQIARGYPLLIFSHGYGVSGFQYTALIEDLVSYGFIVAAVEHTFESGPILLSGNRVVGISPLSTSHYAPPGPGMPYQQALSSVFAWERERGDVWAEDIRFVMDRLTQLDHQQGGPFYKRFNLNRVGAFGHSIGGRFTMRACQLDQRIRACASLDGSSLRGQYLAYAGAQAPSQPLLFLSEHGTGPPLPPPSDAQLKQMHETREEFEQTTQRARAASDRQLQSCRNACYVIDVTEAGMAHMSYSDIPLLSAFGNSEKEEVAIRCLKDLASVVVAFFQRALNSISEPGADFRASQLPSIMVTTYGPH